MRLKIQCPTCHQSDLDDKISEAQCPKCKINIFIAPGNYDVLRDEIEHLISDHKKICSKKIILEVNETDHMLIRCKCLYYKHLAYVDPQL